MAPREAPKATPKVHRTSATKTTASRSKSSPATAIKKTIANKKAIENIPVKMNTAVETRRPRTNTAPTVTTPKPKENKPVPLPNSVTRSAKKPLWKRRPLPAHSGVPVPEKMKQLFRKQLQDLNDSL